MGSSTRTSQLENLELRSIKHLGIQKVDTNKAFPDVHHHTSRVLPLVGTFLQTNLEMDDQKGMDWTKKGWPSTDSFITFEPALEYILKLISKYIKQLYHNLMIIL